MTLFVRWMDIFLETKAHSYCFIFVRTITLLYTHTKVSTHIPPKNNFNHLTHSRVGIKRRVEMCNNLIKNCWVIFCNKNLVKGDPEFVTVWVCSKIEKATFPPQRTTNVSRSNGRYCGIFSKFQKAIPLAPVITDQSKMK